MELTDVSKIRGFRLQVSFSSFVLLCFLYISLFYFYCFYYVKHLFLLNMIYSVFFFLVMIFISLFATWTFQVSTVKLRPRDLLNECVKLTPLQPESLKCLMHDQLGYCVYYNTLCIEGSRILLVTNDLLRANQEVYVDNNLGPSPFHLPLDFSAWKRSELPFRSFFPSFKYVLRSDIIHFTFVKGKSMIAKFDSDESNIFHWVTKIQPAFIARLYEFEGIQNLASLNYSSHVLSNLLQNPGYDHLYYFRPKASLWQQSYAEIALGKANASFGFDFGQLCFETAVIPGQALYLSDGLLPSQLFRELAARTKGIRVPIENRNLITIFSRSDKRRILNLDALVLLLKTIVDPIFHISVVSWNQADSFESQAMHMARTKLFITTHGSVLNHCIFMEPEGAVLELRAFQFRYPLDDKIVLSMGHYYEQYEEELNGTQHLSHVLGVDPFPNLSSRTCMKTPDCLEVRRDANIFVNLGRFEPVLRQAISRVA